MDNPLLDYPGYLLRRAAKSRHAQLWQYLEPLGVGVFEASIIVLIGRNPGVSQAECGRMGFAPPLAAGVLVWASIGGASGSLLLGLLATRLRVYTLTMVAMLASTLAIVAFGRGQSDLTSLSLVAAIAGFATNAGVVGLYALVAAAFPTHLRATATGFVIGVGRGGSALAPALAGLLFKAGYGLATVAILMALGSLIAAFALFTVRARLRTAA